MLIIKTKNKKFTGVFGEINFLLGEAKVSSLSDYEKVWFSKYGATFIDEKTKLVEDPKEELTEATKSKKVKSSKKEVE